MFRVPLVFLGLFTAAQAQIVTEGAAITSPRRVAVEAAVMITNEPGMAISGPEALVRIGVGRGVEARVGLPDYRRTALELGGTGFSDPSVGLAVGLYQRDEWTASAIGAVSLPLGASGYRAAASPLAVAVVERAGDRLTLAAHAETVWDRDAGRLEVGGAGVATVPVRGTVATFGELAWATSADGPAVVLGHGYVVSLTPVLNVDVRLGVGLTSSAPRAFGGVGTAVLF